ncbi:3908_t:CDS:2, partial [Entrophospora sp. SA101]
STIHYLQDSSSVFLFSPIMRGSITSKKLSNDYFGRGIFEVF